MVQRIGLFGRVETTHDGCVKSSYSVIIQVYGVNRDLFAVEVFKFTVHQPSIILHHSNNKTILCD